MVFEDTRLTYAELDRRVNRAAHVLISLGLRPGERLAILSDNSARYLETYLAAAKLGVSVTPLNIRLGDPELDHIVKDSQAVAIAAGDGYEKRAAALLASAPAVRLGLSLDNHLDGFAGYEEIRAQAPDAEPDRERYQVSEDDLAVLMYTVGTTGLPKGVTVKRLISDGLVLSDGDLHQRQRRLLQPAFHSTRMALYADIMREARCRGSTPGRRARRWPWTARCGRSRSPW